MKLHLTILEKILELPTTDLAEFRHMLDEIGLEVKDLLTENGHPVFNIETLANRGDHLSALGIAREFSARDLKAIKHPSLAAAFGDRKSAVPVRKNTPRCMRYALAELTLPREMKQRPDVAAAIGPSQKPAIVDLSNYVLLEMGQPTHAFDRDKIEGEIIIDLTTEPVVIEALDGKSYTVPPDSIVIRDKKKIVAVAGVIGCANSMCTAESTRVLIESASFDPVSVRKTARAMGISTDASYAFERGCDVEAVMPALRRLVYLAEGSGGAVADQGGAHVIGCTYVEGDPVERRKITLRLSEIRRQLNAPRMSDGEVTGRLKNLGFHFENTATPGVWSVTVPSWRLWDTRNEVDLIEDFARIHGLNRLKQELPPLDCSVIEPSSLELLRSRVEPALIGNGFVEVLTKCFYSGAEVEMLSDLDPRMPSRHIHVQNSLERGYSHLKVTNVWHTAKLLEQNARHGLLGAKVFEIGRLFSPEFKNEEYAFEREVLTLGAFGRWSEADFRKPESLEERLQLFRGVLDLVVRSVGQEPSVGESKHPLLHPGMQGTIKAGRAICGVFGVLHPRFKQVFDTRHDFLYAELECAVLARPLAERELQLPSDLPSIKRDLTLKVERRELADRVIRYIEESKPADLADIGVADDFVRQGEDFRRLSLRLTFQSRERTLESGAVDATMASILTMLSEKHQIVLAA